MVEGITTETCIESRIWLYNNNGTYEHSTTNHKRSYLRVIASSNLSAPSLCFGICWYPSVCWHLKLHLVCSLVETNCHTTLSVKHGSSAALDRPQSNKPRNRWSWPCTVNGENYILTPTIPCYWSLHSSRASHRYGEDTCCQPMRSAK